MNNETQGYGASKSWFSTGQGWLVLALVAFIILGIVVGGIIVALVLFGVRGGFLSKRPQEIQVGQVRLKVPQGFEVKAVQGGKALLAPQEGPQDAFRENLTLLVESLPQPLLFHQYARVVLQRNFQALQNFQLGGIRPIQVMGGRGVEFFARGVHRQNPLEFVVLAFVIGQEGYQITLTGSPGKLGQYQAFFQEALAPLGVTYVAATQVPQSGMASPDTFPQGPQGPSFSSEGGWSFPHGDSWQGGSWSLPDTSAGYDTSHDDFNSWSAEEWSRALGDNPPEPTHQDDAGNLYWEGPSGILHDWSPDYPGGDVP
jgi:hypothetical protein